MGQIQVMSTSLANQIAAGEVVVRPASVVKELIENSIDARASTISVRLAEGGISEISLRDDGAGMDEDDALLAFKRHATSKVFVNRDLENIHTLGFRGEALASIAAVARVTMVTRTSQSDAATVIDIAGGELAPVRHTGAAVGTTIEVRDLFYNTPARLKYLRTVQTEQAKCVEVVQRAALSHPHVSFSVATEHSTLFQTPGKGDARQVLASLYGVGEAKQFLELRDATADYDLSGYVGRPTQGRASRAYGHLFVNGRPVRNVAVHQAVISGFKNRLMVGKHPMYAIYLSMDPKLLDVNVHPLKEEVRFSEERDVVQFVQAAVTSVLDDTLLVASPKSRIAHTERQIDATNSDTRRRTYERPLPLDWHAGAARETTTNIYDRAQNQNTDAKMQDIVKGLSSNAVDAGNAADTPSSSKQQRRKQDWILRPIGQALGMYVLADDGASLYIIDQHAAHERILYEEFRSRLTSREVRAMPLLTPVQTTLRPVTFERVMAHQAGLEALGLSTEHFGGFDVIVRTVPDIWEGLSMETLIADLFEQLPDEADVDSSFFERLHDTLALRACKAAVKANWRLSIEELTALCSALPKLDDPFHCPHGRPIFVEWSNEQLEREFRRVV